MKSERFCVGPRHGTVILKDEEPDLQKLLFLRQFLRFLEIRKKKRSWARWPLPLIPVLRSFWLA